MNSETRPILGIAIMSVSMILFPISDGTIKLLSDNYPILLLNWERFVVASLIFVPFGLPALWNRRLSRKEIFDLSLRGVLNVLAISLFFLAIARVPLADALGAYFIAPVIAVVLAIWLLGEKVRGTQTVAIALGFAGALIVVRPTGSTDVGMFFAFGAGIFFALFLIITRRNANSVSVLVSLGIQCLVGLIILAPIAFYCWVPPEEGDFLLIALAGLVWAGAHLSAILAFKFATATTLAPIIYFEIFGGVLVGYMFFGDFPDVLTILGISVVIVAGLLAQKSVDAS